MTNLRRWRKRCPSPSGQRWSVCREQSSCILWRSHTHRFGHDPKWWVEYGGIHWEGNKFRWFWFVCKVCRISYHPEMRSEENSQLTISILRLLSFRLVPNPIAYSMGFNEEYLAPGEYCHGSNSSGMLSTSLWRLGWKRMGCFGRTAPCLVCWRT